MEKWIRENQCKLHVLWIGVLVLSYSVSILRMPEQLRGGVMDSITQMQSRQERINHDFIDRIILLDEQINKITEKND